MHYVTKEETLNKLSAWKIKKEKGLQNGIFN